MFTVDKISCLPEWISCSHSRPAKHTLMGNEQNAINVNLSLNSNAPYCQWIFDGFAAILQLRFSHAFCQFAMHFTCDRDDQHFINFNVVNCVSKMHALRLKSIRKAIYHVCDPCKCISSAFRNNDRASTMLFRRSLSLCAQQLFRWSFVHVGFSRWFCFFSSLESNTRKLLYADGWHYPTNA